MQKNGQNLEMTHFPTAVYWYSKIVNAAGYIWHNH